MINLQLLQKKIEENQGKTIRRTVTFDVDNNCFVQFLRAEMMRKGRDVSYTLVVNDLMREAIETRLKRITDENQRSSITEIN